MSARVTGLTEGLLRHAVLFRPAGVPRAGRFLFWSESGAAPAPPGPADGAEAADGDGPRVEELSVVVPHGAGVRTRSVPALSVSVADALPLLARAPYLADAHPTGRCWGTAVRHALHLVGRGRLLPGLTGDGTAVWRIGPWDAEDTAHLRAVAAAMPVAGHAEPLPGRRPLTLPKPEALLRAAADAVADTLPRTPAAGAAAGAAYGAVEPTRAPELGVWAHRVVAEGDSGVVVSLRLDLSAFRLFDEDPASAPAPDADADTGTDAGAGGTVRRAGALVTYVRHRADPALVADAASLWAGTADAGFAPRSRTDTVAALRRAARCWPPLARLVDRPVPDVLALSDAELWELLTAAAPRLTAAGVEVLWPKDLVRDLTAEAVIRPVAPGSAVDGTAFFDAERLFAFSWELALGGDRLTAAEMDELAAARRPVIRLRDRWVPVDPELVRKARKRQLGLLDPMDALVAGLTGSAEVDGERVPVVPVGVLRELRDGLTAGAAALPDPPGLAVTLRGYQRVGVAWLDRMTSLGLGGCLADDMGLGKTVTLIALHLLRARDRAEPTLVVCPASLLGNWQREIERFAPGVPVRRFHGPGRTLDGVTGGFVLTTYGTARTAAPQLAERAWSLVVADEAQHLKNPRSAVARALRTIPAPARVALTGTPIENNLSELWALLDWTTPGLLGPLTSFRARHARAVESQNEADGGNEEAVARLAALVRPFLLRRRKSDPGIAPELPAKTETDHPVSLTREQVALYRAAVDETMALIGESEGMARRGLIMKLLTTLKQICNHPAQYLGEQGPGGGPVRQAGSRSGKLALLDELLDTILAEGESVLVFTQYVTMARILRAHLASRGVECQLLDGSTPVARRQEMVDRFQEGRVPVFLLSLRAAGTGLNLTRAGHVVHYDRWWNPAVEDQATDRAHRIGQTRPVQVHRLVTEGTVEDRIAELMAGKRALAESIVGAGAGGPWEPTELSDRQLADLVALRRPA
ncbi:DEAD/DEAH box helicase [Streptomyces sp. BI20]|uniref:DEAD/DEAH box helicase n=1 Tax=Streptomyces sp. BI20 TaxID=3403460 RepID=UPI003C70C574